MRIYDDLGYVIPYCQCYMDEIKLGHQIIVMGPSGMFGIIHAKCEHLNKNGEHDRGEFSEVVGRNFKLFPDFECNPIVTKLQYFGLTEEGTFLPVHFLN